VGRVTELSVERARWGIVEHTRRLGEAAAAIGADARVPTAPEWDVASLVRHLGQTQHWVAEIVERRITDPAQLPSEMVAPPDAVGEWPGWLAESSRRVAEAFTDEALAAAVFNPAADERTGGRFWLSSSLNEAVVHGFDGVNAAGWAYDIDADIAGGLIGNHLAMLTSPTWGLLRAESAGAIRGDGETLQWVADDGGAWIVERRAGGAVWRAGAGAADVTVTGPAGALLLVLTRRLPLAEGVRVDGDAGLVEHWLDNTAHDAG
jgi:uncharacterized protein (TIGR03083 family)